LHIEVWELQPNTGRITRNSPPQVLTNTRVIDIDAAGVVTPVTSLLTIPYLALFDNPHPSAARRDDPSSVDVNHSGVRQDLWGRVAGDPSSVGLKFPNFDVQHGPLETPITS
jgi:hypothetical protein